jgi:hypothetical protein
MFSAYWSATRKKNSATTAYIRHYSLTPGAKLAALSVPEKSVDIILKLNKGGAA